MKLKLADMKLGFIVNMQYAVFKIAQIFFL